MRCVSEHDWRRPPEGISDLLSRADADLLTRAAAAHGVTGCVYQSIRSLLTDDQGTALTAGYRQSLGIHLQALADLGRLAPVLEAVDSRWMVVKGPVLSEIIYPRPDLRDYTDLDVVVPPARLGPMLEAIEESGACLMDRNWPLLRQRQVGELLLRLPGGTLLDLHWHLVNEPGPRQAFRISMAEMMERARLLMVGGTALRTLDATDTVIHLGVHGCLSGGNRLVWLKDIDMALARNPPDWNELVLRSRAWKVGLPVALTLARARATLGADVPEGTSEALTSAQVWRKIVALADRLSPVEKAVGKRSFARMVSRSTRAETTASLRELNHHLVEGLRNPLAPEPAPLDMDSSSVRSARYPSGRLHDRQAFLGAVARQDPSLDQ